MVKVNGKKKHAQTERERFGRLLKSLLRRVLLFLNVRIYVGVDPRGAPSFSMIIFPVRPCHLFCGLTGIVTFKTDAYNQEDKQVVTGQSVLLVE